MYERTAVFRLRNEFRRAKITDPRIIFICNFLEESDTDSHAARNGRHLQTVPDKMDHKRDNERFYIESSHVLIHVYSAHITVRYNTCIHTRIPKQYLYSKVRVSVASSVVQLTKSPEQDNTNKICRDIYICI